MSRYQRVGCFRIIWQLWIQCWDHNLMRSLIGGQIGLTGMVAIIGGITVIEVMGGMTAVRAVADRIIGSPGGTVVVVAAVDTGGEDDASLHISCIVIIWVFLVFIPWNWRLGFACACRMEHCLRVLYGLFFF